MTPHILLINPNSSEATSAMMHAIALRSAAGRLDVQTVTASRSPIMIVTPEQLASFMDEMRATLPASNGPAAGRSLLARVFQQRSVIDQLSSVMTWNSV